MAAASLECERAAEELGGRPRTSGAHPEVSVDGMLPEKILEPERRAARIVAQPVRVSSGENQKISRAEPLWLSLVVDLKPTLAGCDDMKGCQSTRSHAEAPRRAERRSAVDRARDAEIAQQRIDRIRLDRAGEAPGQPRAPRSLRFRDFPGRCRAAAHVSCGGTSSSTT